MYCPICFNDSLKVASNGVVRLTFDGKAKNNSQFYYNLNQETIDDVFKKFSEVVEDYLKWYKTFNNRPPIKEVQAISSDFICSNGCKLNISHKLTVEGVLLDKIHLQKIVTELAAKHEIEVDF